MAFLLKMDEKAVLNSILCAGVVWASLEVHCDAAEESERKTLWESCTYEQSMAFYPHFDFCNCIDLLVKHTEVQLFLLSILPWLSFELL